MSKSKIIYQVGTTEDGTPVAAGLYNFKSTFGLPLDIIFDIMASKKIIPSWFHLLGEALDDGVNTSKFMAELRVCILDTYGKEYLDVVWEPMLDFVERNSV